MIKKKTNNLSFILKKSISGLIKIAKKMRKGEITTQSRRVTTVRNNDNNKDKSLTYKS